jgi:ribosomal protein L40E
MFMGGFAYLLYGSMIYKMHRDDLGRIEQDAGRPARDLSEEELKAAMRRRGIEKLELTPEDKKAIAQSRKQRFCVYCGAELTSDAKYCHRCGGKAQ